MTAQEVADIKRAVRYISRGLATPSYHQDKRERELETGILALMKIVERWTHDGPPYL